MMPLTAASVCLLVAALHARWVLAHFSNDGYLHDSGWLAWLFGAGDPWLRNPSVVNPLSFHAHHLSPHLFLFGAPFAAWGVSGIAILAIHQAVFFALFFLSLWLVGLTAPVTGRARFAALALAVLIGTTSDALLQAAAYPHYEIAMLALTSMALAATITGARRVFVLCLIWLPLVREDGGFYAAFVCLASALMRSREPGVGLSRRRLVEMAALEGAVALAAFAIKAVFFPGFDAFRLNYAGNGWDHVSVAFTIERVSALLRNPHIVPVIAGSLILAAIDRRYAIGVVLLTPLYLLHLLSVRPEHGGFTLYYALPWLLPVAVWLAVFVDRSRASIARWPEQAVVAVASLALSAPVLAAIGAPGQFWYVARWSITRPIVDLRGMTQFARAVHRSYGGTPSGYCASMGIAALIPNDLTPSEFLDGSLDLSRCRALMLLSGDMDYPAVTAEARRRGFRPIMAREHAELWMPTPDR